MQVWIEGYYSVDFKHNVELSRKLGSFIRERVRNWQITDLRHFFFKLLLQNGTFWKQVTFYAGDKLVCYQIMVLCLLVTQCSAWPPVRSHGWTVGWLRREPPYWFELPTILSVRWHGDATSKCWDQRSKKSKNHLSFSVWLWCTIWNVWYFVKVIAQSCWYLLSPIGRNLQTSEALSINHKRINWCFTWNKQITNRCDLGDYNFVLIPLDILQRLFDQSHILDYFWRYILLTHLL